MRKYENQSPSLISSSTRRQPRHHHISQSILIELKQAFDLFDPNKTNSISYHELKVIMRALGFEVKKSEVVQLARQYDIQESGRVKYDDYLEIMKKKFQERDPIQEILKAFKLFDCDAKGKIGIQELRKVARELGQTLKEEQLIAMIDQFDRDGDGYINEEEFLSIIRPSTF